MGFKQAFSMAIKSLSTSKARALLTMLGIIIGVAAVIIIISLGNGMQDMINGEFESMGTNLLGVSIFGRNSSRTITDEDMFEIAEKNPEYISGVSPEVFCYTRNKIGTEILTRTHILGVSEQYSSIRNLEVESGRFLQYADILTMNNVCVIGSYINEEYFGSDGIGKTVKIGGDNYTVVGILKEKAGYGQGSDDDYVYLPYTNAHRLNKDASTGSYYFSATSSDTTDTAKWLIDKKLKDVYGSEDYYMIISMAEMMSMMSTIQNTVMSVLVAIAAISLLVGGIGIMNIMLVSVTERTKEIGMRKSLGAKRRDIRRQFIIEAGTTSAIGGVLGIIAGAALAGVAGNMVNITAVPSPGAIMISFGVSVAVGIIFGYLPANKAAKLHPIDALRYD